MVGLHSLVFEARAEQKMQHAGYLHRSNSNFPNLKLETSYLFRSSVPARICYKLVRAALKNSSTDLKDSSLSKETVSS